ncbi:hypothetical protein ACTACN_01190 [Pseudomonas syringae]|uniref:hypothetical protein n=1 Tax=Pseudomonas TaxID=286 RepID=UPI001B45E745|nr:hypothetical protein [Pseudomonas sp. PvP009]MBP1138338.1 hypothetical protein [Pseudomonas sp. PvP009]
MSSPDVSLIGSYRYDALDRLASLAPAPPCVCLQPLWHAIPATSALGVPGFTVQTIDPITGYYLLGNYLKTAAPPWLARPSIQRVR